MNVVNQTYSSPFVSKTTHNECFPLYLLLFLDITFLNKHLIVSRSFKEFF